MAAGYGEEGRAAGGKAAEWRFLGCWLEVLAADLFIFLQRSGLDERAEGELAGSPAELIGSEIRRTREAQAHLFI